MIVQDTPGHLAVSDREHFYRKTYQWLEDLGWVRKPTVTRATNISRSVVLCNASSGRSRTRSSASCHHLPQR